MLVGPALSESLPRPLEDLGWDGGWAAAGALFAGDLAPARVVRVERGLYSALSVSGLERLSLSGRMLEQVAWVPADAPCVGDWVLFRRWCDGCATLEQVLPRRSRLDAGETGGTAARSAGAANVDVAAVVAGLDGDVSITALERQLSLVRAGGAVAVVALTKADLAPDAEELAYRVRDALQGVEVIVCSSVDGRGIDRLGRLARRRTLAFLGAAGSGTSSLVRRIAGTDILEVRAGTPKRRAQPAPARCALVVLPGGGCLVETHGGLRR